MVDCAEGTLRQFALQPPKDIGKVLKASQINKIFVTHMHRESAPQVYSTTVHLGGTPADHVMGLPTFLRTVLGFPHPGDIAPRGAPVSVCLSTILGDLTPLTNSLSSSRGLTCTAQQAFVPSSAPPFP